MSTEPHPGLAPNSPQGLRAVVVNSASLDEFLAATGIVDHIIKLIAAAQRLFPGELTLELQDDPELPSERSLIFNVQAAGDPASIVDRCIEWHDSARALVGSRASHLRLCTDAVE